MRAAVVTDAVSADYFFPIWYKYYAAQFGVENIFVFTYQGSAVDFAGFQLGGIRTIPDSYNDDLRRDKISEFVDELLNDFQTVIRVDVDEFLIADPSKYTNLSDFLSKWEGTYVTAFGFDVIQSPEERILDFSKPIMGQRQFAYALTAMNKTCITRTPIRWGRGFHYCSVPPQFGEVFLLHAKRVDIKMQKDWNDKMRERGSNDAYVQKYYSWQQEQINVYHSNRFNLPLVEGDDAMVRTDFNRHFLTQIKYVEKTGIYDGPYDIDQVNIRIPSSFRSFF